MRRSLIGAAAVIIASVACSRETPPPTIGGEHVHTAPHGGTLVELGDEFAHVELVLDANTGTLTAYALDGEAEESVRMPQSSIAMRFTVNDAAPQEATLQGVSNALTGESAADTSQFRAVVSALKDVATFEGSLTAVVIRGQRFEDVAFRYPSTEHD